MILTNKSTHNDRGFSLFELLIAIAIFGVIVALIINAYTSQQGQSITQQQAVEIQQTARASMFLISGRIRTAGHNPGNKQDVGITAAGDGSIGNPLDFSYYDYIDFGEDGLDNDTDGSTDEDDEEGTGFTSVLKTLSYVLNDQNGDGDTDIVENNNGGGNQLLAENVSTLNFAYLDQDNNITATLDDIRAIQIIITATTDSNELNRSIGNNTRTLTSVIKCRNLGL